MQPNSYFLMNRISNINYYTCFVYINIVNICNSSDAFGS